jgi:hypothetical protein
VGRRCVVVFRGVVVGAWALVVVAGVVAGVAVVGTGDSVDPAAGDVAGGIAVAVVGAVGGGTTWPLPEAPPHAPSAGNAARVIQHHHTRIARTLPARPGRTGHR